MPSKPIKDEPIDDYEDNSSLTRLQKANFQQQLASSMQQNVIDNNVPSTSSNLKNIKQEQESEGEGEGADEEWRSQQETRKLKKGRKRKKDNACTNRQDRTQICNNNLPTSFNRQKVKTEIEEEANPIIDPNVNLNKVKKEPKERSPESLEAFVNRRKAVKVMKKLLPTQDKETIQNTLIDLTKPLFAETTGNEEKRKSARLNNKRTYPMAFHSDGETPLNREEMIKVIIAITDPSGCEYKLNIEVRGRNLIIEFYNVEEEPMDHQNNRHIRNDNPPANVEAGQNAMDVDEDEEVNPIDEMEQGSVELADDSNVTQNKNDPGISKTSIAQKVNTEIEEENTRDFADDDLLGSADPDVMDIISKEREEELLGDHGKISDGDMEVERRTNAEISRAIAEAEPMDSQDLGAFFSDYHEQPNREKSTVGDQSEESQRRENENRDFNPSSIHNTPSKDTRPEGDQQDQGMSSTSSKRRNTNNSRCASLLSEMAAVTKASAALDSDDESDDDGMSSTGDLSEHSKRPRTPRGRYSPDAHRRTNSRLTMSALSVDTHRNTDLNADGSGPSSSSAVSHAQSTPDPDRLSSYHKRRGGSQSTNRPRKKRSPSVQLSIDEGINDDDTDSQDEEYEDLPIVIDDPSYQLTDQMKEMFNKTKNEVSAEWDFSPRILADVYNNLKEGEQARLPESIHIGEFIMKTWYGSPFPAEYIKAKTMFICEFCLFYGRSDMIMQNHAKKCRLRAPPGIEIYRRDNISVFEVDGRKQKGYCQTLCLLSRSYLESKTVFYDTEPFFFYVVTINDEVGCHFAGYFSKEKYEPDVNNLSCIMTLPCFQDKGLGRFLIDVSYALSRKEEWNGGPEQPLSDLGRKAYGGYWKTAVSVSLAHFMQTLEHGPGLSVQMIANHTGINSHDVLEVLGALGWARTGKANERNIHMIDWDVDWDLVDMITRESQANTSNKIQFDEKCLDWEPRKMKPSMDGYHELTKEEIEEDELKKKNNLLKTPNHDSMEQATPTSSSMPIGSVKKVRKTVRRFGMRRKRFHAPHHLSRDITCTLPHEPPQKTPSPEVLQNLPHNEVLQDDLYVILDEDPREPSQEAIHKNLHKVDTEDLQKVPRKSPRTSRSKSSSENRPKELRSRGHNRSVGRNLKLEVAKKIKVPEPGEGRITDEEDEKRRLQKKIKKSLGRCSESASIRDKNREETPDDDKPGPSNRPFGRRPRSNRGNDDHMEPSTSTSDQKAPPIPTGKSRQRTRDGNNTEETDDSDPLSSDDDDDRPFGSHKGKNGRIHRGKRGSRKRKSVSGKKFPQNFGVRPGSDRINDTIREEIDLKPGTSTSDEKPMKVVEHKREDMMKESNAENTDAEKTITSDVDMEENHDDTNLHPLEEELAKNYNIGTPESYHSSPPLSPQPQIMPGQMNFCDDDDNQYEDSDIAPPLLVSEVNLHAESEGVDGLEPGRSDAPLLAQNMGEMNGYSSGDDDAPPRLSPQYKNEDHEEEEEEMAEQLQRVSAPPPPPPPIQQQQSQNGINYEEPQTYHEPMSTGPSSAMRVTPQMSQIPSSQQNMMTSTPQHHYSQPNSHQQTTPGSGGIPSCGPVYNHSTPEQQNQQFMSPQMAGMPASVSSVHSVHNNNSMEMVGGPASIQHTPQQQYDIGHSMGQMPQDNGPMVNNVQTIEQQNQMMMQQHGFNSPPMPQVPPPQHQQQQVQQVQQQQQQQQQEVVQQPPPQIPSIVPAPATTNGRRRSESAATQRKQRQRNTPATSAAPPVVQTQMSYPGMMMPHMQMPGYAGIPPYYTYPAFPMGENGFYHPYNYPNMFPQMAQMNYDWRHPMASFPGQPVPDGNGTAAAGTANYQFPPGASQMQYFQHNAR